jgi:hypothetical protein
VYLREEEEEEEEEEPRKRRIRTIPRTLSRAREV